MNKTITSAPGKRSDFLLLIVVLCLAHWRGFFFSPYVPRWSLRVDSLLWILLCSFALRALFKEQIASAYYAAWKQNWLLFPFLFFCFCSLFWTIDLGITLYRLVAMLSASLIAAYIGMRHSLHRLLEMLSAGFILLVTGSLGLVFAFPELGIMVDEPYAGSWRGLYWHKNYLGSAMALANLVFLYHVVNGYVVRSREALLSGLFYLLSFALIVLSRSATGMILFALLHGVFLVGWGWSKWHSRLYKRHYYFLGSLLIGLIVFAAFNLDSLLGLVGRSSSLTGRVPMWNYLLTTVLNGRLFWGFGFGALWAQYAFREQVQTVLGWGYPVITADNGFLDVVLYVGIPGFVLFVCALVHAIGQFIRFALYNRTLTSLMPTMFTLYLLTVNITLSHFFEIESFTWMILLMLLFAVTSTNKYQTL